MMVFEGVIGLGIACLLAPAIAEFAKLRNKADRGFSWLAVAGVFFLFSATFGFVPSMLGTIFTSLYLAELFSAIGWVLALFGTLFVGYEMLFEK
jgi:hypothetical protein